MAGTARRVSGLGWAGLAWAEGLPGTIGGAVFGNAGCYGGDIASSLEYATLLVGDEMEQWPAVRMGYGYRISTLKERGRHQAPATGQWQPIVVGAAIRLQRGDRQELAATMARIAAERRGKTPWGHSCGSVFKNPAGASAGGLIEQAGLKGTRRGSAEISERHGNYIVNHGGASSDDILGLIAVAQNEVLRQFGVQLELEVQIV
jgi:UDP-N-acetylmuramate dehydrogenase